MGPESPLGFLMRDEGYGLLLGVGYQANTFHHVVEMSTGAPCLGMRTRSFPAAARRWPSGRGADVELSIPSLPPQRRRSLPTVD